MSDKLWKAVERQIADTFGGSRVPITGRGDLPDVIAGGLGIEVKVRKRDIPKWIQKAVRQAVEGAEAVREEYGQRVFPLVVLHVKGQEYMDDYVLLRVSDLIELLDGRTWDSGQGAWVSESDTPEAGRSVSTTRFVWDGERGVGVWDDDSAQC